MVWSMRGRGRGGLGAVGLRVGMAGRLTTNGGGLRAPGLTGHQGWPGCGCGVGCFWVPDGDGGMSEAGKTGGSGTPPAFGKLRSASRRDGDADAGMTEGSDLAGWVA